MGSLCLKLGDGRCLELGLNADEKGILEVSPRGVAQLVERRSPKPQVAGSSPVAPAILTAFLAHREELLICAAIALKSSELRFETSKKRFSSDFQLTALASFIMPSENSPLDLSMPSIELVPATT